MILDLSNDMYIMDEEDLALKSDMANKDAKSHLSTNLNKHTEARGAKSNLKKSQNVKKTNKAIKGSALSMQKKSKTTLKNL